MPFRALAGDSALWVHLSKASQVTCFRVAQPHCHVLLNKLSCQVQPKLPEAFSDPERKSQLSFATGEANTYLASLLACLVQRAAHCTRQPKAHDST